MVAPWTEYLAILASIHLAKAPLSIGRQAIGQSLAWNCCLLVLDLHGCGVGDSGAEVPMPGAKFCAGS